MIESISGELFFHSALLDSLTISVWHIQMTVTHHHTLPSIHFTSPLPRVFTCTQSHWTNEHSELWKLRKIRTSKDFSLLNCNCLFHQEYLHILCFGFYLPFLHFADQCRCRVVISVLGGKPCSVSFSCMGNIGSSWVMLPDGRPHVCWLKGNGRGMPAMPRQPGEVMAEHIMPAWMWGLWHQV